MIENRQKARVACRATLILDREGQNVEARVLDLSQTGIRLECGLRLKVGSRISLRFPGNALKGKAIRAVVRWVRIGEPHEIGLEFASPQHKFSRQWISRLYPGIWAEEYSEQRRSEVRARISLPVALGDFKEGRLLDVSRSGARFEIDSPIEKEESLYLCLPRTLLEIEAERVRSEKSGDRWIHSVKFSDRTIEQKATLEAFLAHQYRIG